ncbi:hypothetical protein D9M73_116900 [compost metagenome]
MAAIGDDHPAIVRQRVQRTFVDGDVEQAIARHIERHGIARGERDRAKPRRDQPAIADARAEQRDIATIGAERAFVEHRSAAIAGKCVAPGHEVLVRQAECRGDQPADIHLRALAEQDAIGVDQEHLPIGVQRTEDRRRIGPGHAVERDRRAARLNEGHRFRRGDVEARPVDRDVGRGLRHRHRIGVGHDRGTARADDTARRLRISGGDQAQPQRSGQRAGAPRAGRAPFARRNRAGEAGRTRGGGFACHERCSRRMIVKRWSRVFAIIRRI